MTAPNTPKISYALFKPLEDGLFLVRRTTDGELLLARPLDDTNNTNNNDTLASLIRHGAARPAAQLLNHENLISIHDELVNMTLPQNSDPTSSSSETQRMLLWSYPEAGTLQDVLSDYLPPPGGGVFDATESGGFLPESFIWHVTLGLLRALQWLHEGVRETYDCKALGPGDFPSSSSSSAKGNAAKKPFRRVRGRLDENAERDWWPVLHRNLTAGNVFLQQPRGVETYGAVRVGGFESCYVSGGVAKTKEAPVVAMEAGTGEDGVGVAVLRERLGRWKRDGLGLEEDIRPYTQGSELFDVGALLYRMMCGRELPPAEECPACGCVHLWCDDTAEHTPCEHDCVADVNVDTVYRPLSKYTTELKGLATLLLRLNRNVDWWPSDVMDIAWRGYERWADSTEDGLLYRDIYDDMWFRKQNLARLKKKEREAEQEEAMQLDNEVLVY